MTTRPRLTKMLRLLDGLLEDPQWLEAFAQMLTETLPNDKNVLEACVGARCELPVGDHFEDREVQIIIRCGAPNVLKARHKEDELDWPLFGEVWDQETLKRFLAAS